MFLWGAIYPHTKTRDTNTAEIVVIFRCPCRDCRAGEHSPFGIPTALVSRVGYHRTRVFEEAKVNPSVQRQLVGNYIDSPVCAKALELLRGKEFSYIPSDLTIAVKTLFAMPGTVACELSNKATRKQQDRAQEHCKVTGERTPPICFCNSSNRCS